MQVALLHLFVCWLWLWRCVARWSVAAALDVAKRAALEAGALIRAATEQLIVVTVKSGVDLVTETDKACEELITKRLHDAFPEHGFVGEETTFAVGSAAEVSRAPHPPAGGCRVWVALHAAGLG